MFAAASEVDIGQLANVAQYGLLGVIFLAIIFKRGLVPQWALDALDDSHKRELAVKDEIIAGHRADIAELKATITGLQALTSEKMIPALVQANSLSAAYVAELARRGTDGH
jgi:hypothetical protein